MTTTSRPTDTAADVRAPAPPNTGSAYDMALSTFDEDLVRVGKGTAGGELLRRYWLPVGLSGEATTTPREVRLLGEDLILYRDRSGTVGLLHPRCAHRGTTLLYGKVEDRGIRCCYHGWAFDEQGLCLDQPCEPGGGLHRDRVVQPWYPVEEHYGLVFAYLGPLGRKPPFTPIALLEGLGPGEELVTNGDSIGSGGWEPVVACNWFQAFENVVDPFHVVILHAAFTGNQFTDRMGVMPTVDFDFTDTGVTATSQRRLPDGRSHHRRAEISLPCIRWVPDPFERRMGPVDTIGWQVPLDDTHHRIFNVFRVGSPEAGEELRKGLDVAVTREGVRTPEDRRESPNDLEAQVGQGDITLHSEEHLATTDRGVTMWRRQFRRSAAAVAEGRDPAGVHRDPGAAITTSAGSWVAEGPAGD